MLRFALATISALVLVLWTMPARTVLAPVAKAAELPAGIPSVYLHLPKELPTTQPVQVLVALHGMGGNGEQFAANFLKDAERNHWLIVAPTIDYGDWTDPAQVAREDPRLIRWLAGYLEHLDLYAGVPVKPRVLLLGHSRGAQLAHRFAFFEPQRVLAVAALGVGTEDNNPAELPRAWDQYLGTTRVQRALIFQAALHDLGARSVLVIFRGEKHALSAQMAASAGSFLRALDLAHVDPAQAIGTPIPVKGARNARAHF